MSTPRAGPQTPRVAPTALPAGLTDICLIVRHVLDTVQAQSLSGNLGELGPSAPELPALLAPNVRPELYDRLVWVVGQTAPRQTDPQLKAYREAVRWALAS